MFNRAGNEWQLDTDVNRNIVLKTDTIIPIDSQVIYKFGAFYRKFMVAYQKVAFRKSSNCEVRPSVILMQI